MIPIPTQESQKVVFQGKHLAFLTKYTPSQPKSTLEMAVWAALEAYLSGEMPLFDLYRWIHGTLERVRDTPDEYLPVVGVLSTIISYERIQIPGGEGGPVYSLEDVYGRIEDVWNWMALGTSVVLVGVQKSGPLPLPERTLSLLEQDIRVKLGEYLGNQMVLPELIGWLENPLLLWEMLVQAGTDPVFYEWVMSLHRILAFYTESRDTREQEVYDLLSRLAQA